MYRFGSVTEAKELAYHTAIGACLGCMKQSGIQHDQFELTFQSIENDGEYTHVGCAITCFPDEKREIDPITGKLKNETAHFTVIRYEQVNIIRVCFENLRWGDDGCELPEVDYILKFDETTGELDYEFNTYNIPAEDDTQHANVLLRYNWFISYIAGALLSITNKNPNEYFKGEPEGTVS